jgi:hypothetical protein
MELSVTYGVFSDEAAKLLRFRAGWLSSAELSNQLKSMKSFAAFAGALLTGSVIAAEIRIGIVGCDTSHVIAFTDTWNNPTAKGHVPGARVVAAFPGGSPDIPESANRLDGYVKKLKEQYGVKIYDTIEGLCANVDAICLESLDGRPKLEQLKPILAARKPVYVDKPMAASLRDVIEMFRLAKAVKVPIFSSSSLRFASNSVAVRNGAVGKVSYAETYGPCSIEPHHPDLFWYGVHGTEALFTIMGGGCKTVSRGATTDGKIEVTGDWGHGRKGIFREEKGFRGMARGAKGEAPAGGFDGYAPLVLEITKFFQTRVAPVKPEETIEIFAFMEAADESKRLNGAPVKISDMIKRAKAKK